MKIQNVDLGFYDKICSDLFPLNKTQTIYSPQQYESLNNCVDIEFVF